MQVELSFIFPHALRELPVSLLIPLPAQRPRTVANLSFMCTGQLPLPNELHNALHLSPSEVAYATPEEAKAAGLLALSDSAVVRIDKSAVLEIGSSTTKSIFGGFVPEEVVTLPSDVAARGQSIAATMGQLKAGTLLYGNLGMPNTQASRYYILLESMTSPAQRAEFAGFVPLGMVTSGLADLKRAAAQTAVQPRTLVPKKRVVVSGCRMQLDYAQIAFTAPEPQQAGAAEGAGGAAAAGAAAASAAGRRRPTEAHERVAGRVRRRDEDAAGEGEDGAAEADPRRAFEAELEGGSGAAPNKATGFFNLSARFPKAVAAAVASSGAGSSLKRRRAEAYVMGSDGVPTLRTTAIAPGQRGGGAGDDGAAPFEFFTAQQDAFLNDIEGIKDAQTQRLRRKGGKGRKHHAAVLGSQRGRASQQQQQQRQTRSAHRGARSGTARAAAASSSSSSSKAGGVKTVTRRY